MEELLTDWRDFTTDKRFPEYRLNGHGLSIRIGQHLYYPGMTKSDDYFVMCDAVGVGATHFTAMSLDVAKQRAVEIVRGRVRLLDEQLTNLLRGRV